jgi:hypothetical protein
MKAPKYQSLIYTLIGVLVFYSLVVFLLLTLEVGTPGAHMDGIQDVLWYIVATITTVGVWRYCSCYLLGQEHWFFGIAVKFRGLWFYNRSDCQFYEYTKRTKRVGPQWHLL